MRYWLVKQEPSDYSWQTFVKEKGSTWTGVRNFQARNNLRSMKKGDPVLFYHSGEGKQVVGLARVAREAYPDPSSPAEDWSCVDLVPLQPLTKPVSLAQIKEDRTLKDMAIVKQSRLSVLPVSAEQFQRILDLAETRL